MAEAFWQSAFESEPYPRDLKDAAACALPVAIVPQSDLQVSRVLRWLKQNGVAPLPAIRDRALRACLIARRGQGLIFLDADDPEDEQRFSVAHEIAHFLRDYQTPREAATHQLGPTILEVLDGGRLASLDEQVHALLARVPLGLHLHLFERDGAGQFAYRATEEAEEAADVLACELLAPVQDVLSDLTTPTQEQLTRLITGKYGLPESQAQRYAQRLTPSEPPLLLVRLGLLP
jgi:Zn-dependent peptidase ImmA (M78 family)